MARTNKDIIAEEYDLLSELAERYSGTAYRQRIKALMILKRDPYCTLKDLARRVGCSLPTVSRWWKTYKDEGIEALLEMKARGRKPIVDEETLEKLREKVAASELQGVREVQAWLEESEGVHYSTSGAWYLLNMKVHPSEGVSKRANSNYSKSAIGRNLQKNDDDLFPEHILRFMNGLPVTHLVRNWVTILREGLMNLFNDIDFVTITVNSACKLQSLESYDPGMRISRSVSDPNEDKREEVTIDLIKGPTSHGDLFIERHARKGFPINDYHPPTILVYFLSEKAYLGVMALWRSIKLPQISDQTLDSIKALEPFFIFMLSDCVAREQHAKPIESVFHEAFVMLNEEAKLSRQERRIVGLQLLGHSYKEIADMLNISLDTVGKHINTIHRKTNTRSYTELFAKYFTPRYAS